MNKQLFLLGLILLSGCQKPDSSPALVPDAASVIAGTYTAKSTTVFGDTKQYPISGKTMTLQIDRVAPDTVRVHLQAPANGVYSPAKDTTYANVYVVTKPQAYYLPLEPAIDPGTLENQITISSETALYVFIPPGYTKGSVSAQFSKTK